MVSMPMRATIRWRITRGRKRWSRCRKSAPRACLGNGKWALSGCRHGRHGQSEMSPVGYTRMERCAPAVHRDRLAGSSVNDVDAFCAVGLEFHGGRALAVVKSGAFLRRVPNASRFRRHACLSEIVLKPIVQSQQTRQRLLHLFVGPCWKRRARWKDGHKIIKLNIGSLARVRLEPPDEIVQDMIRNLSGAAGGYRSKGLLRHASRWCTTVRKRAFRV